VNFDRSCLLTRFGACVLGVAVAFGGLGVVRGGCVFQDGGGEQAVEKHGFDQALALETFDFAWKLVRDSYFRDDMNGVDWDAVRAELRPKVEEVTTNGQLRMILQDMVGRLHQSHFEVIPGDRSRRKNAKKAGNSKDNSKLSDGVEHGETATHTEGHEEKGEVPSTKGAAGSKSESSGEESAMESPVVDEGDHRAGGDDDEDVVVDGENESEQDDVGSAVDDKAKSQTNIKSDSSSSKATIGGVGIDVRLIGDEVVVTRVRKGSVSDKAGVRPGWVIHFIGGVEMKTVLNEIRDGGYGDAIGLYGWQAVTGMLNGRVGTKRTVRFFDGEGEERAIDLVREEEPGQMVKFGNLPALHVTATSREEEFEGAKIGVIRFSMWMFPAVGPIGRAMEDFADSDGIILDLRGNVGGIGGMVMGIGGYFFDKPISLGTMFQRGQKLKFNVNPRGVSISGKKRDTYLGPVAILLDGESASTTEMFAAGMQATGRARVFGETSAGMALPSVATKLPNGDILLHAIADFEDPNGVSIEGRGVIPDEEIALSRDRLFAGHDDVMEAALEWIGANRDWRWEGKN